MDAPPRPHGAAAASERSPGKGNLNRSCLRCGHYHPAPQLPKLSALNRPCRCDANPPNGRAVASIFPSPIAHLVPTGTASQDVRFRVDSTHRRHRPDISSARHCPADSPPLPSGLAPDMAVRSPSAQCPRGTPVPVGGHAPIHGGELPCQCEPVFSL